MTDRDRLKGIFKKIEYTPFEEMTMKSKVKDQFTDYALDCIVDEILANGVIVPPCKVGDTLYFLPKYIKDWIYDDVEYITIHKDHFLIKTVADWYFEESDFGKTVFLTKEEAEKALAERIEGK